MGDDQNVYVVDYQGLSYPQPFYQMPGPQITLRDQLAAACLSAIYSTMTQMTDRAAELAYEQADEMMKARVQGDG